MLTCFSSLLAFVSFGFQGAVKCISNGPLQSLLELLVEISGIEPLTPCLQSRCSPN